MDEWVRDEGVLWRVGHQKFEMIVAVSVSGVMSEPSQESDSLGLSGETPQLVFSRSSLPVEPRTGIPISLG